MITLELAHSLSTLTTSYKVKLFGTSPKPEKVRVGTNDWLYLHYFPANYVPRPFTEAELDVMTAKILERAEFCRENGIQYYFAIAPNKATIYPENWDPSLHYFGEGFEQFRNRLEGAG
jgi:hypothetical protein